MALRAEVAKEFKLCSVNDPAIDRDGGFAEAYAYVQERDPTKLKLLDGAQPTWFVCKPLSASVRLSVESKEEDVHTYWWAFRYGVQSIENLEGEHWIRDTTESGIKGWDFISDKSMERLVELLGAGVVDEIGHAILTRARLTRDQKKGYSLPPTVRVTR